LVHPVNHQLGKKENLEKLTLHDLCDLLAENNILLLNPTEKKVEELLFATKEKS